MSYDLLLAIACQRRVEHSFNSLEHFTEQICENTTVNKSHHQYFQSVKRKTINFKKQHICYAKIDIFLSIPGFAPDISILQLRKGAFT